VPPPSYLVAERCWDQVHWAVEAAAEQAARDASYRNTLRTMSAMCAEGQLTVEDCERGKQEALRMGVPFSR
jgi:hypothetical protein